MNWKPVASFLTVVTIAFQGITTWDSVSFSPTTTKSTSIGSQQTEEQKTIQELRDKIAELECKLCKTQGKDNIVKRNRELPEQRAYRGPVYYPRHWTAGHWTWPGDLRHHLIRVHGVDSSRVNNASPEQLMRWHDYTHVHPNWRSEVESRKKPKQRIRNVWSRSQYSGQYCPT